MATAAVAVAIAGQPLIKPGGPGNSSPVDLLIGVAILCVGLWLSAGQVRVYFPYLIPGALLVIVGAASGLTSAFTSASLLSVIQTAILVLWAGILATAALSPGGLRTVLVTWAGSSVAWAALLLFGEVTKNGAIEGAQARLGERASLTFGDPNYAALYFVISCFIVYAAGWPRHRGWRSMAYLLLLSAVVFTGSNGGLLEISAGVLVIVLLKITHRWGGPTAVAVALSLAMVLGAASQLVSPSAIQQWAARSSQPLISNSVGRVNQSASERGTLVHESWQLFTDNGLLGSGPSTTKTVLTVHNAAYQKEAHDDYLAGLVEEGPLGLGAVLLLMGCVSVYGARLARRKVNPTLAAALRHPEGFVGALASIAVAMTYYETLHFRFVWAVFALTAAAQLRPPQR